MSRMTRRIDWCVERTISRPFYAWKCQISFFNLLLSRNSVRLALCIYASTITADMAQISFFRAVEFGIILSIISAAVPSRRHLMVAPRRNWAFSGLKSDISPSPTSCKRTRPSRSPSGETIRPRRMQWVFLTWGSVVVVIVSPHPDHKLLLLYRFTLP